MVEVKLREDLYGSIKYNMSTLKHLKDLTLKEFDEYKELIEDKEPDTLKILELFNCDTSIMLYDELIKKTNEIFNMKLTNIGVFDTYIIGGKLFKVNLDLTKMTAGQFIDFQTYMKDYKLQNILSVFLIPVKVETKIKKGLFKDKTITIETPYKYSDGYDTLDIINFLYENFTIGNADELAAFFLSQSNQLLEVMTVYFQNQEKEMKEKQKQQLI